MELINSVTYNLGLAIAYNILNIYMIKMACVFMLTNSTLAIRTRLAPRWLAIVGYMVSMLLLFGSYYIRWSFVLFPLWVFLLSVYILADQENPSSEGERRADYK